MSSKQAEDAARAGWEIYRDSNFSLARDQINERLAKKGHVAISRRMHDHYGRLHRRGYRHYVPINRLDTLTLADPFYYQSVRSRYSYYPTHSPVRLLVASDGDLYELTGQAVSISNVGTEVAVDDKDQRRALETSPPPVGAHVTVDFLDPPATFHGRIATTESLEDRTLIDVEFARLQRIQDVTRQRALKTSQARVTVQAPTADLQLLDEVARELFLVLQALESARAVTNEVVRAFGLEDDVVAAPTTVRALSMQSPLVLEIGIATPALGFAAWAARRVLKDRVLLHEGTIKKRQAEVLDAHTDFIRAQTERTRAQTSLAITGTTSFRDALTSLLHAVRQLAPQEIDPSNATELNAERIDGLVFDELQPSLAALQELGVESLEIQEVEGGKAGDEPEKTPETRSNRE